MTANLFNNKKIRLFDALGSHLASITFLYSRYCPESKKSMQTFCFLSWVRGLDVPWMFTK